MGLTSSTPAPPKPPKVPKPKPNLVPKPGPGPEPEPEQEMELEPKLDAKPVINYSMDWDSTVVGMEKAKRSLDAALSLPVKFPTFSDGIPVVRSLLLWGPPGTGKTKLAHAFSKGCGTEYEFVAFTPGDHMSAYWGETAEKIKTIFSRAMQVPTVLFIDELDAFGQSRDNEGGNGGAFMRQIFTQLLQSMQEFLDKKEHRSFLIGCTNTVSELDSALRRRFSALIFCDLPNANERYQLLKMYVPEIERDAELDDAFLKDIAEKMNLYSGSDILKFANNIREAPLIQIQRATHFRLDTTNAKWEPCLPTSVGAMEHTLKTLPPDSLATRRRCNRSDVQSCLESFRPNITKKEYDKYLAELDRIGGGDLSKRVNASDENVGFIDQRSSEEIEIDNIFIGCDIYQAEPSKIREELSSYYDDFSFKSMIAFQRFSVQASTQHGSGSRRAKESMQLWVLMFLATCCLIPGALWVLVATVSSLILANVLIAPLYGWIISMNEESNANQENLLTSEIKEFFFIFFLSVVFSFGNFITITSYRIMDALVVTWMIYNLQQFVGVIFGFQYFKKRSARRIKTLTTALSRGQALIQSTDETSASRPRIRPIVIAQEMTAETPRASLPESEVEQ